MKKPGASNTSSKWPENRSGQWPENRSTKREPFAMEPQSVLECHELAASARCVYALMAMKLRGGNVSKVGQRELSRRLGFARSTVEESIAQLLKLGKIETACPRTSRDQASYRLLSNVFVARDNEPQASGARAKPKSYPCVNCGKPCRDAKRGLCWGCKRDVEIDNGVRRALASMRAVV